MTFNISVDGADKRVRFDWEAAAAAWTGRVSPIVVAAIKVRAPVSKGLDPKGPKPGKLRDSITSRIDRSAGLTSLVVYSGVPYAKFVIGGTRPHPIRPKNAQALHWVAEDGDHFARFVNHPGTKANDFAQRAVEPLMPLIVALFAEAAKEAIF